MKSKIAHATTFMKFKQFSSPPFWRRFSDLLGRGVGSQRV